MGDTSPKCYLRKMTADLRQMSGPQIPKRIRQKGTSTLYLPNAKGKCQKYLNNDFRQSTQAELQRSLNLKAILSHRCSLHLKNQDREPKLRIFLNQRPVAISKLMPGCETTVRNPQRPQ